MFASMKLPMPLLVQRGTGRSRLAALLAAMSLCRFCCDCYSPLPLFVHRSRSTNYGSNRPNRRGIPPCTGVVVGCGGTGAVNSPYQVSIPHQNRRLVPGGLFWRVLAASSTTRIAAVQASQEQQRDDDVNGKIGHRDGCCVHVVLFGVGDLRVDDHVGLHRALQETTMTIQQQQKQQQTNTDSSSLMEHKILTAVYIDEVNTLPNLPGVVAHTIDTAHLLHAAITDLGQSLHNQCGGIPLHVIWSSDHDTLESVDPSHPQDKDRVNGSTLSSRSSILQILPEILLTAAGQDKDNVLAVAKLILHVCDLGLVDNELAYGPYSQLQCHVPPNNNNHQHPTGVSIEVRPWTCHLRHDPWEQISQLPEDYPSYSSMFQSSTIQTPANTTQFGERGTTMIPTDRMVSLPQYQCIPSEQDLTDRMIKLLDLNSTQCQAEVNSGLYATHWGGLDAKSIGASVALDAVQTYAQVCQFDDQVWARQSLTRRSCQRNPGSLEHAAMLWQLRADGSYPVGNLQQWLAGEGMVRYLAAPLLFGTISPRRIHALASNTRATGLLDQLTTRMTPKYNNPLIQLVEGREWHQLLAARNMVTNPKEYPSSLSIDGSNTNLPPAGQTIYKYWRYHGFLCRFAQTPLADVLPTARGKSGALLVHGFGASGSQWNKCFAELAEAQSQAVVELFHEGLAPDLLGFGQSEKPALSYTGYLWDGMMMDFVKEHALQPRRHSWTRFITGGNSIGGYTSMALAACDSATMKPTPSHNDHADTTSQQRRLVVTSNGAPGTNTCQGLVLMNSAGPVKTRDEVDMEQTTAAERRKLRLESVAQVTAQDALPSSNFLQRPLSRWFGLALLWYMRPSIRSICTRLYPTNPAAVDEALCENIRRDSLDPGAINVMMAGAKLPPPRTANELLGADFGGAPPPDQVLVDVEETAFSGPVLIAQGVLDPLNDAPDRMRRFGGLRPGITTQPIMAGHCPHDELPADVAKSILYWISAVRSFAGKDDLVTTATSASTASSTASASFSPLSQPTTTVRSESS